ncbi:hypothetical protein MNR01_06445 [Lysobacter sp. S4-A87]|uniref:hypothetical protein n=1 Tax=Lysobacter sp. S4-A87 TaxID=2925843 RepID=UPI001F5303B0|nr:hypothetical protein [Lysobacter sp. S4-A87]UNK50640.1 hypothetical protein MNR01_06445 [Lysobacter sp. S4-A87]
MILASATLVAGSRHEKYAAGTSLPALLFVNVHSDDELEEVASRELADLGWASMAIDRYKDVTNHEQFQAKDTPEAGAFRDALETGFAVVVYP